MTKHPASPLARLVARLLPAQPAPQPEQPEEPEEEPTVKMYRFIKYGD